MGEDWLRHAPRRAAAPPAELRRWILAALSDGEERCVVEVAWDVWADGLDDPRPPWWRWFRGRVRTQLRLLYRRGVLGRCERDRDGHAYYRKT